MMASSTMDDEKPNLRPIKHNDACGKTIFLHHNPNQTLTEPYIYATHETINDQNLRDTRPFHIVYSVNKHQRWELLNDLCQKNTQRSDLIPVNDRQTQSDTEKKPTRVKASRHLLRFQNANQCLCYIRPLAKHLRLQDVTDESDEEQIHQPKTTTVRRRKKTYVKNIDSTTRDHSANMSYFAVVPISQEKGCINIRKSFYSYSKAIKTSSQRATLIELKQHNDTEDIDDESEDDNDDDIPWNDDDESLLLYYTYTVPDQIQLNDFISNQPTIDKSQFKSKFNDSSRLTTANAKEEHLTKDKHRFYRQISKEEKLLNRDMTIFVKKQQQNGQAVIPKPKSHHHSMSLSFRKIFIRQSDFTVEHLSATFGKNFFCAQCYPTKYLVSLTDRLKTIDWAHKFQYFSLYAALNCYLIIILNDEVTGTEDICRADVALNMDLMFDTVHIRTLSTSDRMIYSIEALIDETLDFVTSLSFDKFKPIDLEINQNKYFRNDTENELSESEFINEQIKRINLLDTKNVSEKRGNDVPSKNNDSMNRPDICVICCTDMNESMQMTALKVCRHWLCNQCWRQYLESSVKSNKVICCPEWNCCTVVDFGTMLSLINIRCVNIYERNLERCLVNLSRLHIKCPSSTCGVIFQVVNTGLNYVRCRCSHQFCIDCKQEPHFPASCRAYRAYMDELIKNGDLVLNNHSKCTIPGRHCISCHDFIEKNGGCNHMTCRCGAEFCWLCTGIWKDHFSACGDFVCPKKTISLEKQIFKKERNPSRTLYENAIFHRFERTYQNQVKQNENVKRLVGTIPLNKENSFDLTLMKSEVEKREAILRHAYEMVKYIAHLHCLCEFIAVASDGYGGEPREFLNSLHPIETLTFNMTQLIESGRGYQAIEQLNDLHTKSEKFVERLRQVVQMRRLYRYDPNGYATS